MIALASTTDNDPFFRLGLHAGAVRAMIRGNTGGVALTQVSTGTYNDGERHLAVAVWDGDMIALYVDGVWRAASSAGTPGTLSLNTATIGAMRRAAVGQWAAATLDEAIFAAHAITATEIDALYEARDTPLSVPSSIQMVI